MILGDAITLGLVTLFGFGFHREADAWGRMLSTWIPLLAAWLLVAPHLDAFAPERVRLARQLWRPFWAMVLAAPLAALIRGFWLGAPIQPIFVVVLGGFSALALLGWRAGFWALVARKGSGDG